MSCDVCICSVEGLCTLGSGHHVYDLIIAVVANLHIIPLIGPFHAVPLAWFHVCKQQTLDENLLCQPEWLATNMASPQDSMDI